MTKPRDVVIKRGEVVVHTEDFSLKIATDLKMYIRYQGWSRFKYMGEDCNKGFDSEEKTQFLLKFADNLEKEIEDKEKRKKADKEDKEENNDGNASERHN